MTVHCPLESHLNNPGRPNPQKGLQKKGLAAIHSNVEGRLALWMPANCSKMSKQSQHQGEQEQRPRHEPAQTTVEG